MPLLAALPLLELRGSKLAKARACAPAASGSAENFGRLGHGPLLAAVPLPERRESNFAKARACALAARRSGKRSGRLWYGMVSYGTVMY